MTLAQFKSSLHGDQPPEVGTALSALWYEAKGDWVKAHKLVQDEETRDAAWIHAYLHRREGDASNAGYWYTQAGRPYPDNSLENEWNQLATHFLEGLLNTPPPRAAGA